MTAHRIAPTIAAPTAAARPLPNPPAGAGATAGMGSVTQTPLMVRAAIVVPKTRGDAGSAGEAGKAAASARPPGAWRANGKAAGGAASRGPQADENAAIGLPS